MQHSVPKASGSRLTKLRKEEEWAAEVIHLTDDKNGVSELPRCPNGSSLIELYLKGNYELTVIPPLFFKRMALLQVLDLSRTSIKSLPKSLPKLVALKKLLLQSCDLFMELSPQVGKLKNLEELDLDETQILDLPRETGKLLKLTKLRVSFYHLCGKKKSKSNILIHPETISNLSQLDELSIDVNPADKRWDDSVETVLKEVCNSKSLSTLILYLPEVQLLDNISSIYPSLSCFRFTVGRNNRKIISRVPHEVEAKFRNWEKCFKFVSGENISIEIKEVLKYSTSFFLDRHATAVNLSEFGVENMKGLKFCLLSECNKMVTLIDEEMHYGRNEDDQSESAPDSIIHVLESLEYLSIYYMDNLQSIWRGPNSFECMSNLKFLALHTCPRLSEIFSHTLIENFVNLEEIILEDCPQVTSLVGHASIKPIMSDKMFLPRLKRLLLLYLPELVSISNGLLIAPKLESIGCYNCPKLKSISKKELSSKTLKRIKGECQWWEGMNWNETEWGNQPDYLMRIFSPIDNDKDVMTQLVEARDLLEATMQIEGQQLGDKNLLEGSTQDHKGQCLDVTECPSACIFSSSPLLRTSPAPEQAGNYISEKYKSLEDDHRDLDSNFFEDDVDDDEPKPKRWNCSENENKGIIGSASKSTRKHRATNEFRSKVFVFDDGYRWRKYGTKTVRGNPYPRSYYKCLSRGCPGRKHVEQDSQDPRFFVTTYEGIHNHGDVRGLYNLHSQPFNDHRANKVEQVAETAKSFNPTKGYGDVIEASIQEAPQPAGTTVPASVPQFFQPVQSPSVPIPEHYGGASTTTSVGAGSPPSLQIKSVEPSNLKLIFPKALSLPIFVGTKITDEESKQLQVVLVDTRGDQMTPVLLQNPIKVDIVVVDGNFWSREGFNWTVEEFDRSIVRERTGKRPLLAGELAVTLRDGVASIGNIEFTDNSSWIQSRKFRIGAKVAQGSCQGVRIREAITEAFVVKDHRSVFCVDLYRKHYPPMLGDEVWRLEKIGKDGSFHRKLTSEGVYNVQDFLKMSVVDPAKLRRILGPGMSEKMWDATIKHAKTCVMGNKYYAFRGPNYEIFLSPICQLMKAKINGNVYPIQSLSRDDRGYVEDLVRKAYVNWSSLEEIEGICNEIGLLTQAAEPQPSALKIRMSESMETTPLSFTRRPQNGDSGLDFKKEDWFDLDASKKRNTVPRRRQQVRVRTVTALGESIDDDGFCWRKYGQKDILGAKYPRSYYRCTHQNVQQGCMAKKQTQRSDNDPTILQITCIGEHTCNLASNVQTNPSSLGSFSSGSSITTDNSAEFSTSVVDDTLVGDLFPFQSCPAIPEEYLDID